MALFHSAFGPDTDIDPIILGRDLRDSATQALKDLNWLTLVKKRTIDRCIFVYKCLNNLIEFDFGFK